MEKQTREDIKIATQRARALLEQDFAEQLQGDYDVMIDGRVGDKPGSHLTGRQRALRARIVAAIDHKRAQGMTATGAVVDYLRDAAFTTFNRFVALKMLESRGLVQECISKGEASSGFVNEFCAFAPGLKLPDGSGYRLYIESIFDELSTEVKVLFDRRDAASALWPRKAAFDELLSILNEDDLKSVWAEDETIGWVYQYFNSGEERRKMRGASQAPRNSREMAIRNQFFTPKYIVKFLADNTLGRIWFEMRRGETALRDFCSFMVRRTGEELIPLAKKDPRDLKALDPACGSGHFLLYLFALLLVIYEEAYHDPVSPKSEATGNTLQEDYPSIDALRQAIPALILARNLHGVDIDPRCAQIAQLALWMRAQKAYNDLDIARADRPSIRRSNIVVAEPLIVDERLTTEFIVKLGDDRLGDLFTTLISGLRLAGDLGLLLRIEKMVGQHSTDLFTPDEQLIRTALDQFMQGAGAVASPRQRLFAEDAVHGVALLGIAEKKFDVVLMNPPFGEFVSATSAHVKKEYPTGANDVFTTMVVRGRELLNPDGRLGAITSRAFMLGRDHRRFREALLSDEGQKLALLLDLGAGVLDQAMVETAAFVIASGSDELAVRSLTEIANKEEALEHGAEWKGFDLSHFREMPMSQLIYKLEREAGSALNDRTRSLEPAFGRVTKGLSTPDNSRFLRLRWELGSDAVDRGWQLCAKGGDYGWWSGDLYLLVNRRDDGTEMAAASLLADGNVARTRQSSAYYGLPAATWSCRSQKGFSARRLRAGACFLHKSGVIVPTGHDLDEDAILAVIAALASHEYQSLIAAQSRFGAFETGMVGLLPVPDSLLQAPERWAELPQLIDEFESHDERTLVFRKPCPPDWRPAEALGDAFDRLDERLQFHGHTLDQNVRGFEIERIEALRNEVDHVSAWRSFIFGMAVGRWGISAAARPNGNDEASLFQDLGASSPAQAHREGDSSGILCDDAGSPDDIVTRVLACAEEAKLSGFVDEGVLDGEKQELRDWFAQCFFHRHLRLYSRSQRAAPIYWQLATPSASYSIWLYIHATSKDALFRIQADYATPKLAYEERRLDSLRAEIGERGTATQRKAVAAQEVFVEELRAFLAELKRVAPLWNPNLDDGVIINFAPLWRLVPQHKAWQKELRSTWDGLCQGNYDWAHIAMHLWPERVIPKCATNRSLAIAHDLEQVFWSEDEHGKWKPREVPPRQIQDLVSDRSSQAVKAALQGLIDAPELAGPSKAGRSKRAS